MDVSMPAYLEDREKDKEAGALLMRMLEARTIMVSETITDKLACRVTQLAILMQQDDSQAPISVYVNSPGGSADAGFAIFDILRFVLPPVRCICTGLCASAAVLIYLAAERKYRYCLPNARFLLHQPSTTLYGAASDIEINANEIIKLRERYNRIVAAETQKSVEQVTQQADRDFWLAAEEALEYGLVGRIVTSYDQLDKS